jgi:hypothetical protein
MADQLWRKPNYLEKTTDLSQVTDRQLYRLHITMNRNRSLIGIDCMLDSNKKKTTGYEISYLQEAT